MNNKKNKSIDFDLCEIKLKYVNQEEEKENERTQKISRLFNRFLEKKSRDQSREQFGFKESLEDVIGI